jgi:hypothetical protein
VKAFISSIILLSLTVEGAEFKELLRYYSVPRQTINEYREVGGDVYDIGKRKTFETILYRAHPLKDPRAYRAVRNAPRPLTNWGYIGSQYKVIDKFDGGVLIGQLAREFTGGISGRRYSYQKKMQAFLINHPKFKEIAAGDKVQCWAMDTKTTKKTDHGPVKIYDHGKHVSSPHKNEPKGSPTNKP